MLIVYTGDGKGKTSATIGQAIRALGAGLSLAFLHFFKRTDIAGECLILRKLLNERYYNTGIGFFTHKKDFLLHRHEAEKALQFAWDNFSSVDMLLLDEALYALEASIITREEIENLIDYATEHKKHLVLSGRKPRSFRWLWNKADLISSIQCVKHPMQSNIKAQKGIEF